MTTVLEYVESTTGKPATVLTVARTKKSSYQFYLAVRSVKKRLGLKPHFLVYEKSSFPAIKGMMEEHSILDAAVGNYGSKRLYVMEGFYHRDVMSLRVPEGTYVVAETDGGELQTDNYTQSKRRDILKVLTLLLDSKLSLRGLLKQDWSGIREFEEFEPYLRKAQLMGWTEDQIGEELKSAEWGNLLTLIKRSDTKALADLLDRGGSQWIHSRLVRALTDLVHYQSLRSMGFEEGRAARDMDIEGRSWRIKELEDSAKMYTLADLRSLACRLIKFDTLVMRTKAVGLLVLMLNAEVRVRK